ncbi:gliding motility-associated C-terminal domain-containing protein [Aquirufa sp. LEPPI-3A]|uniref:T9SS type B sorting domain-containing protein n=1 Tax=Aquirufa regiilacus TaxID=3024868 RepID=UPI0028DE634F|nr:gliding motility-associated C-terminal domain-containing protein [Aquirufa sp. LEPPI-3A]MDT8887192.1 gliding motility-associated C-terminal domain-containing protein [Aquirufa sp. LEPPI-3A]
MLRSIFLFCLLMGVNFFTWGQRIIYRNNCLTPCADCSSSASSDMATVFEFSENLPSNSKYLWDFGDSGSPSNTSTDHTGIHQYCSPGAKTVTLTVQTGTTTTKYTQVVQIGRLPFIYLGKDEKDSTITICKGQKVTLKAFGKVGKPNYPIQIAWFPKGETTDEIVADSSGCYAVQVTEPTSGCTVEAKMQVKICGDRDPNANINKYVDAWYFGNGAGVLFIGSADFPKDTTGGLVVPEGVAKMTDPTNSLIFYTDGQKIFDRNNNPIYAVGDTTKRLNGDLSNAQGVTVIPKTSCKGCQAEYYVFTLSKNTKGENLLYYSIVDMKLNKGKGGISVLNQLVSPVPATSRLLASEGGQGYYWLVVQDMNSNTTRTYKISNVGISAPQTSVGGTQMTSTTGNGSTTKISVDWTKMAVAVPGPPRNKVDLFDFDPSTGKPTYQMSIDLGPSPPTVYGLEYSPNKDVLYVSLKGDGVSVPSTILQFDLSSKDSVNVAKSKEELYSSFEKIGALQVDPVFNTVIFVAIDGSNTLAKITNPNGLLNATDTTIVKASFVRNAVTFSTPGVTSRLGLPPSIPSPQDPSSPPSISKPKCKGTSFEFTIDQKLCDPLNNDRIDWKIYQTVLSPFPNKIGLMVPLDSTKLIYSFTGATLKFDFPVSGKYVITAAISNSCIKNFPLDAQEFDIVVLKPTQLTPVYNRICKTDALVVPTQLPISSNLQYQWSTGARTPSVQIPAPGGKVSLMLSDYATGCSVKLSTEVNFLDNPHFIPKTAYSICMDEPKPYNLQLNGKVDSLKFEWKLGSAVISTQNKVRVTLAGTYTVRITDLDNCSIDHTFAVSDKCEPTLLTPNVFTPNNDGKNDFFIPQPKSPLRAKILGLQIFNRWGELLYTSKGPEFAWDGKVNGTRVPQESYVWQLQYESLDYPERGTLTDRGGVLVIY